MVRLQKLSTVWPLSLLWNNADAALQRPCRNTSVEYHGERPYTLGKSRLLKLVWPEDQTDRDPGFAAV